LRHHFTYREYTRTPKLSNISKFEQYAKEALTMHNSFIVIIDNPTVGIEIEPLTTFKYPSALHTHNLFDHPVLLENGLFPVVYKRSYGIRQRLINFDLRTYREYAIQSVGKLLGNDNMTDAINLGRSGRLTKGYFFKIYGINLATGVTS
jgi:hypothetical protein